MSSDEQCALICDPAHMFVLAAAYGATC